MRARTFYGLMLICVGALILSMIMFWRDAPSQMHAAAGSERTFLSEK